jgi:hypothetical protein
MEIQKDAHLLHYLALFVGLAVISTFFIIFRYNYQTQVLLALIGSGYYTIWGILHHSFEKRLSRFVVLEYILFGLLAFLLIFTALNI